MSSHTPPPPDIVKGKAIKGAMWNGEPCVAVEVYALLPEHDPERHPPRAWWRNPKEDRKGFRPAIAILAGHYWGDWFVIDDEEAIGLDKIMRGGGPGHRHRDLPKDCMLVLREEAADAV